LPGEGIDVIFLYDGWRCIEERQDDNGWEARRQYVFGGQYLDEVLIFDTDTDDDGDCTEGEGAGSTRHLYCSNNNFNVMALTDANGAVVERVKYDPYGQPTCTRTSDSDVTTASHFANPWLFQGQRYCSETGVYYFKNRDMRPDLGRFLQRDPLGYVDGLNLYGQEGGSPHRLDTYGLSPDMPAHSTEVKDKYTWVEDDSDSRQGHWEPENGYNKDPRRDELRDPYWSSGESSRGNCLRFATCSPVPADSERAKHQAMPGSAPRPDAWTGENVMARMVASGAVTKNADGSCPECTYKIAVFVSPEGPGNVNDYHFLRQDGDSWEGKGGYEAVTNRDASGKPITDPATANMHRTFTATDRYGRSVTITVNYEFVGYLCWPFNKRIP